MLLLCRDISFTFSICSFILISEKKELNYSSMTKKYSMKRFLGGDYMIPVCQDEISARPAGTDFTLRVYVEI